MLIVYSLKPGKCNNPLSADVSWYMCRIQMQRKNTDTVGRAHLIASACTFLSMPVPWGRKLCHYAETDSHLAGDHFPFNQWKYRRGRTLFQYTDIVYVRRDHLVGGVHVRLMNESTVQGENCVSIVKQFVVRRTLDAAYLVGRGSRTWLYMLQVCVVISSYDHIWSLC